MVPYIAPISRTAVAFYLAVALLLVCSGHHTAAIAILVALS